MTLSELRDLLACRNVKPEAVCFGSVGVEQTESYCIERVGGVWEVYYYERGEKGGLACFADEDRACRYFLALLEDDESVWKRP